MMCEGCNTRRPCNIGLGSSKQGPLTRTTRQTDSSTSSTADSVVDAGLPLLLWAPPWLLPPDDSNRWVCMVA
jgi:hypothetical protein